MYSQLLVSALVASAAATAVPHNQPQPNKGYSWGDKSPAAPTGANGKNQPFRFPLSNGFPNIQVPSDALTAIQKQAHGTLPNGALPKKINDTSATVLELIAFNEIFEVAYFTSLLGNITDGTFDVGKGAAKDIVVNAITAVQAQEELHALGANAILATAGRTPIKPCEYKFPTTDFDSSISLAATFTDVVLGTLQDALEAFGTDGDSELLALIGSVIGQEGEQVGFYRNIGKKIPSALPFLTRSTAPFAYSALNQVFIVPGSCPNANIIDIPIYEPLTVVTPPTAPEDTTVTFSIAKKAGVDVTKMSIVYINQQNVPVSEPVRSVAEKDGQITFCADFPGEKNLMNGLTIAGLAMGAGPFADVAAATAATKYGPGLIEIN
ncbi:hypothetical protein CLAFUW4_12511 [Fulvia fulva]|uniref:Sexual development protein n=1 Tax=Passalora fulva TaxID=5499 RepID=A0A9Q8PDT0_PASFU|nr:uncharacterized protein CLAFUR5_11537 [Fulvia fulva]KAK4617950.1 hypothetical protein CLAFUR4_12516 [Fulvia fulva]KAK4618871.1 hypothetical protein CLAFUR0_12527 [Fulvia fulva]UJO20581.1 hypothetical protein CLAFUR5_11537 [Fulvia fulva]WPV18600.1 hypothetical protein CLAFUW4_12511 [Fulvia fulva]WPV33380.1 hypothetical protein CLAFUW7_12518 [Fulvia fulva]